MEYPALLTICEELLGKFQRSQLSQTAATEQLICEQGGRALELTIAVADNSVVLPQWFEQRMSLQLNCMIFLKEEMWA